MSEPKMPRTIAVDFDNTLFETDWPEIGNPIWPVINAAKTAKEEGAALILWTTREGKPLEDAIIACNKVGLTFDAINNNTAAMKKLWGNDPRKVGATEYWDDRAMKLTGYIPRIESSTITADKLGAPPASKIAPRRKDDSVSHPEHYTQGAIECIDAIRASMGNFEFASYCKGNIIKYLWRYRLKNGAEDLRKARVYLDWMIEAEEKAAAECAT